MAQLTWKNVDAPTFSSVTESQRLMATLLNKGFDSARSAITDFQKEVEDMRSNQYMADLMRFTDPAALDAAIRAGTASNIDPRHISPNALEFGAGRSADLLRNEGARQDLLAKPIHREGLMLDNEGKRLGNQGTGLRNEGIMIGNAQSGLDLVQDRTSWGREQDQLAIQDEAKKLAQSIFSGGAYSPQDYQRRVRASGMPIEVQNMALNMDMSTLFGGAPTYADIAAGGAGQIVYANQNATRNDPLSQDLEGAISPILKDLGVTMKVVSGGQESADAVKSGKGSRTGSTRHDHGNAADVDFFIGDRKLSPKNPQDLPILQEIVRRGWASGIQGWGEGDDYMGEGRVHLGFGGAAVWGAGGKSENAPQWIKDALKGAPQGRPAAQTASPVQTLLDQATQVEQQSVTLATQAQDLITEMDVDDVFNVNAPLVTELLERPNEGKHSADLAKQLHGEIGDDDGLRIDQIQDEIDYVTKKHGVSADYAAALIKNAVNETGWGAFRETVWGQRHVGREEVDRLVNELFDKSTGKLDAKKANSLIKAQQTKENIKTQLGGLTAAVDAAKAEYYQAVQQRSRNPNVDVLGAYQRWQSAKDMLDKSLESFSSNELTRAFSNSDTGR